MTSRRTKSGVVGSTASIFDIHPRPSSSALKELQTAIVSAASNLSLMTRVPSTVSVSTVLAIRFAKKTAARSPGSSLSIRSCSRPLAAKRICRVTFQEAANMPNPAIKPPIRVCQLLIVSMVTQPHQPSQNAIIAISSSAAQAGQLECNFIKRLWSVANGLSRGRHAPASCPIAVYQPPSSRYPKAIGIGRPLPSRPFPAVFSVLTGALRAADGRI
jgi:hypothetical protein